MPFGRDQQFVINPNGVPELLAELAQCPAHKVTPLFSLPGLAARLGVGEIRVKDESQRFGFGAFKALGGVLAVYDVLSGAVGEATHASTTFAALMRREHAEVTAGHVFTTASSGNHGRSVAAGAKLFGNRCVIFLPKFTSADKEAAIRARGAEVIRVNGDYDTAVAECRRQAGANGWTIVSDTSWEGYDAIPRSVMRGYTVLVEEIVQQWRSGPTHVFVQAGVGGLAAAVFGYLWARYEPRPVFIVVEPESADCWFQSNLSGKPAPASGNADTAMGGLACREISPVTWPVIGLGADWFMTIAEDGVLPARRLFAHPPSSNSGEGDPGEGDPAITSGPSGCAGLAGLTRVCADAAAFKALGLGKDARVLLINSEGDLGEPLEALQLSPTAMQDRQMQARRFGTKDEEKLQRAGAQVLQDLGFQIDESETKLGLIVASKSRDATEAGQIVGAIFVALLVGVHMATDKHQKIRASMVTKLVDGGSDTMVRITFQRVVWNTQNQISKNERLNEPKLYQEFFDKLQQSVFLTAQEV